MPTSKISEKCYVHLNGRAIGHVADPLSFVKEVRNSRRKGALSGEVNIVLSRQGLTSFT